MKDLDAAQAKDETGGTMNARFFLGIIGIAIAFAWSYSYVILDLWKVWDNDDNFSAGLIVPFIAAFLIFVKRKKLAEYPIRPSWWGLPVIVAGFALRFLGTLLYFASVERFSVLIVITGLVITLCGLRFTWRLKWILIFLLLMLPWPNRVYQTISNPLQSLASISAVFMLETLGWVVKKSGNIIQIGDARLFVAEACSGLRMLTAFMIVGALVAFLCHRTPWQKVILFASAIVIAVLCNTIRLTSIAIVYAQNWGDGLNGILEKIGYTKGFNTFFHDFGGILMMPLALILLAGELVLLKNLLTPISPKTEKESGKTDEMPNSM